MNNKSKNCSVNSTAQAHDISESRVNVCVEDYPLTNYKDGHTYCLFHLPDPNKDFHEFEIRVRKRIKSSKPFFHYTYFPESFDFLDERFENLANFYRSYFHGEVIFNDTIFENGAYFIGTGFNANVSFSNVKFQGPTVFHDIQFQKLATFEDASFSAVSFLAVRSRDHVSFEGAQFSDLPIFTNSSFYTLWLSKATFNNSNFEDGSNQKSYELPFNNQSMPRIYRLVIDVKQLHSSADQITEKLTSFLAVNRFDNKDLISIPPEVLKNIESGADLLEYYTNISIDRRELNEAKVLVVGQGSVGKTSLIKRLIENEFNPTEEKTELSIRKDWKPFINNREVQLNVWDFGGQEIMHHTHQFFLTKRSLYILVLDARLDSEENRIDYWLEKIKILGDNSPVIIVGNKSDQQPFRINQKGFIDKYPNIKGFYTTSCRDEEGLDTFKIDLLKEIGSLSGINDALPVSWFNVKLILETMRKDYISIEDFYDICEQNNIIVKGEKNNLVRLLHDLGIVLNFDDDRLQDTNVLNPDWVTKGVYKVINTKEEFINQGELTRKMLDQILDPEKYPPAKQMFVLDMMQKFELCFEIEKDKKYLIPDLLAEEELVSEKDWEDSLKFEYRYKTYFGSILTKFIIRRNEDINEKLYWKTGVVLKYEIGGEIKNQALVKSENNKINIFVNGSPYTRRDFLTIIRKTFDEINRQTFREFKDENVSEKIPVDGQPDSVVDYLHLLNMLELGEEFIIPEGLKKKYSVKELLEGVDVFNKKALDNYVEKLKLKISETDLKIEQIERKARNFGQLQVLPPFVIMGLVIIGIITYTSLAGFTFYTIIISLLLIAVQVAISFYKGIDWNFTKATEKAIENERSALYKASEIDLELHLYRKKKLKEAEFELRALNE